MSRGDKRKEMGKHFHDDHDMFPNRSFGFSEQMIK
jgi:hypothetical protein